MKRTTAYAMIGVLLLVGTAVVLLSPPLRTALAGCGACAVGTAPAKTCGPNCTKPCCAAKGVAVAQGANAKTPCGADCTKPCCAAKNTAADAPARGAHLRGALAALDDAHKAIEAGDKKAALKGLDRARGLIQAHHHTVTGRLAAMPPAVNTTCPMSGKPIQPAFIRAYKDHGIGFCGPGCAATWDGLPQSSRAALFGKVHSHDEAKGVTGPTGRFANTRCPIMGSKLDPKNVPDHLTREYNGRTVAFCCGGCPAAWDKLSDSQKEAKLAKWRGN